MIHTTSHCIDEGVRIGTSFFDLGKMKRTERMVCKEIFDLKGLDKLKKKVAKTLQICNEGISSNARQNAEH